MQPGSVQDSVGHSVGGMLAGSRDTGVVGHAVHTPVTKEHPADAEINERLLKLKTVGVPPGNIVCLH